MTEQRLHCAFEQYAANAASWALTGVKHVATPLLFTHQLKSGSPAVFFAVRSRVYAEATEKVYLQGVFEIENPVSFLWLKARHLHNCKSPETLGGVFNVWSSISWLFLSSPLCPNVLPVVYHPDLWILLCQSFNHHLHLCTTYPPILPVSPEPREDVIIRLFALQKGFSVAQTTQTFFFFKVMLSSRIAKVLFVRSYFTCTNRRALCLALFPQLNCWMSANWNWRDGNQFGSFTLACN